jgi:hypothetical protein
MKTTLKFFAPTLLMFAFLAAFTASTAIIAYAQDDTPEVAADKKRLYDDCMIKDKAYRSTDEVVRKAAFECGREYVKKYPTDSIGVWIKGKLDDYDADVAAKKKAAEEKAIYERFDNAYKSGKATKNWTEFFAAGKAVLAKFPDDVDTMIDLAIKGYDIALENNTTFNADTLSYAKATIAKIEAGTPSITGTYGGNIVLKTKTYTDGKANTLGWMNYIVSFLSNGGKVVADKPTVEAYYKIQQFKGSEASKFASIYSTIASWYLTEFNKVGTDVDSKLKVSGGKETEETVKLVALQKGVADRAMEAYARTYKAYKDASMVATATAAVKDANSKNAASTLKIITEIYKFRFGKKAIVGTEVETFVTGVLTKPFTEPNAPFIPVAAPVAPVVTPPVTTPPTTKPVTTTPPTTTPPTTKPAVKPVVKPAVKKPKK